MAKIVVTIEDVVPGEARITMDFDTPTDLSGNTKLTPAQGYAKYITEALYRATPHEFLSTFKADGLDQFGNPIHYENGKAVAGVGQDKSN